MFVSGFTFVRNAVKFDYPVKESILSLLPLVDELIVCLGNSDDTTADLIQSINSPKIKIVSSVWDDSLREGGRVLAVETDKALAAVSPQADWCIYLQADEVIHENDYLVIRAAMEEFKSDPKVEGLLFNYIHFYGSYHYVGNSRKWYRHEVRIIRNDRKIHSYKDAQGFRKDDRPLKVKKIKARIFHYGWVKNPAHQTEKQKSFHRLWHSDEKVKAKVKEELFDYSEIDSLEEFTSTHPAPMKIRIENMDWVFYYDTRQNKLSFKNKILQFVEKQTGKRLFEYRNYRVI
ncbi:MAG: glycosyltransferase family 2 protein [Bacteroidia bacterium]|nr:glycosyltransferase family 2 protein [Bacteroidota bacterium]MBP7244262.1 glycosyltransferase family 2 protein [Bacteroidia bacterium]